MEGFPEHVDRLRRERKISQSQLIHDAASYANKGTSLSTVRNAVTGKRRGTKKLPAPQPSIAVMEAIARVLGVEPTVFDAYRLALARRLFDEREMGLEAAVANLSRIDEALALAGEEALDDEAERAERQSRRSEQDDDETPQIGGGPS